MSVRSRKSSNGYSSDTAQSPPSKLRAPDNSTSAWPLGGHKRSPSGSLVPSRSASGIGLDTYLANNSQQQQQQQHLSPSTSPTSKQTKFPQSASVNNISSLHSPQEDGAKRNRKRSFRLSSGSSTTSGDSPSRFVRGIKRVSSAFKSNASSHSQASSEAYSDSEGRHSRASSDRSSPLPEHSQPVQQQPSPASSSPPPAPSVPFEPQTPKASTNQSVQQQQQQQQTESNEASPTITANVHPGSSSSSPKMSSFLVVNPTADTEGPHASTSSPSASDSSAQQPLSSVHTPLGEHPPQPMAPSQQQQQQDPPPASVGFPEVDQLGDATQEQRQQEWQDPQKGGDTVQVIRTPPIEEQPLTLDTVAEEAPAPPASTDYPPVDSLVRATRNAEAEQQRQSELKEVVQSSSSSSSSSSQPDENDFAPSHSLTLSAWRALFRSSTYSMSVSTRRKLYLVLGSLAINLCLPFINGVMLGLGEIFARETVAIYFGIGPKASQANAPRPARANVGQVGLRAAAESGGGNPKPGHPAAKTAAEFVEDSVKRV